MADGNWSAWIGLIGYPVPVDRAVFLDRDNTLIANDGDLGDPALVQIVDGVPAGLARLRAAGWRLIVVTNQGGVARGKYTEQDVDAVHQQIATLIEQQAGMSTLIERFYYCPFHPEGTVEDYRREHPWRKPAPGMLRQAAHDLSLDLSQSWMIGDTARDIEAGRAAGCRTVLVSRDARIAQSSGADAVAETFADAVAIVLNDAARSSRSARGAARSRNSRGTAEPSARTAVAVDVKPATRLTSLVGTLPTAAVGSAVTDDSAGLRRAIADLTDELRSERQRKAEFTMLKMAAAFGELFVILLAALGLLHLSSFESFSQWMLGALLMQLIVIALLVLDLKG